LAAQMSASTLIFLDMEQMIGDDYETGLANLKEILEAE
jgi:hypothetical protein